MDPQDMGMGPMLLPKGFVLNTDYIYREVASYPVVPPEKIYEYWHVYTTTFRQLIDPTASRLENFWWHVMGSDRRHLSGATLARLFEEISKGDPAIPLRGPPNRYEPPSPHTSGPEKPAESSSQAASQKGKARAGDVGTSQSASSAVSSSTKPPPHPILKKARGPSTSGPRPTARFISPPGSEAEDDSRDSEVASSGSTAVNPSLETRSSRDGISKEERKKASTNGSKKKGAAFVASSASKRRPQMPRRPSSQSSTGGSEVGSREGSSSLGSRYLGSHRPVTTIAEQPDGGMPPNGRQGGERLSAKAAGKRPAVQLSPQKTTGNAPQATNTHASDRPVVVQRMDPTSPQLENLNYPDDHTTETTMRDTGRVTTVSAASAGAHRRSDAQERARPEPGLKMSRSRSHMDAPRSGSRELTFGRVPPQGLLSSSTATTSNIAAQGTIIESDETMLANQVATETPGGHEDDDQPGRRRPGTSLVEAPHWTPTQPSSTPTMPLARTKSQLTLLLERDGEQKAKR